MNHNKIYVYYAWHTLAITGQPKIIRMYMVAPKRLTWGKEVNLSGMFCSEQLSELPWPKELWYD